MGVKIDVFSKVDFGKASPSQKTKYAIIAQLLSYAIAGPIGHVCLP